MRDMFSVANLLLHRRSTPTSARGQNQCGEDTQSAHDWSLLYPVLVEYCTQVDLRCHYGRPLMIIVDCITAWYEIALYPGLKNLSACIISLAFTASE